MIDDRDVINS